MPVGENVSLITSESDLSEGIYVAKQINRMVGGIDMLDAQTYLSRGDTPEPMGFSDIAVLYRTHRQAEILEKCLQKESIPYVVAGRDDTLADKNVRACICFFRFLLDSKDVISLETCLKTIWNCPQESDLSIKTFLSRGTGGKDVLSALQKEYSDCGPLRGFLRLAERFLPRCKKEKPQKLVQDWMAEHSLKSAKAMDRFLRLSVFHRDMPSFLRALTLGQESDPHAQFLWKAVCLRRGHADNAARFKRDGVSRCFPLRRKKRWNPAGFHRVSSRSGRGTQAVLCWHYARQA